MKWFMVDLKIFLGLAMPNQYCLDVTKLVLAGFRVIFSNLHDPYNFTVLLYCIIINDLVFSYLYRITGIICEKKCSQIGNFF